MEEDINENNAIHNALPSGYATALHDAGNFQGREETLGQNEITKPVSDSDMFNKVQRDGLIHQLRHKLTQCIQEGDQDAESKLLEVTHEVDHLMHMVRDGFGPLKNQDCSSKISNENIEMKNKLMILQEDYTKKIESLESVQRELDTKSKAFRDMEQKYKLLIKMHKESKEKHFKEISEKDDSIRSISEELNESEDRISLSLDQSKNEKAKAEIEIEDLKLRIQTFSSTITQMESDHKEEKFKWENNLKTMQEQMSQNHHKEMEIIKERHLGDVNQIVEQIENLEKNQRENELKMKEMYDEGLLLKSELDIERKNNMKISKEAQNFEIKLNDLVSKFDFSFEEGRNSPSNDDNQFENKLENVLLRVENECIRLIENEKLVMMELNSLRTKLERENVSKEEANIKIKELNIKMESLLCELVDKKSELLSELHDKDTLQESLRETEVKYELANNENIKLSCQLLNLQSELSLLNSEKQVQLSTPDIDSIKQSIVDMKQYQTRYDKINKSLNKLLHLLYTRGYIHTETTFDEFINQVSSNDEICELEKKIINIDDKTKVTDFLLKENKQYKEEIDRLNMKIKSLSDHDGFHCTLNENHSKVFVSCQTVDVPTCDRGFQTPCFDKDAGIVSTKTIEEDYIMEEIFVIPKTFASKNDIEKPLKQITCTETPVEPVISTSPCLNCESLRHKYHDALFMVKSLENENAALRHSCKLKSSSTDISSLGLTVNENKKSDFVNKVNMPSNSTNENIKASFQANYNTEVENSGSKLNANVTSSTLNKENRFEDNQNGIVPSEALSDQYVSNHQRGDVYGVCDGNERIVAPINTVEESHLIKELEDITSSIVDRAHEEKVALLQNQQAMMLKILEGNQLKISEICRKHIEKMKEISVHDLNLLDMDISLSSLAQAIDASMSEELQWVESEYSELLRQYSHEQSLESQSHSHTLQEVRQRICLLLQKVELQFQVSKRKNDELCDGNFHSVLSSPDSFAVNTLTDNSDLWNRLLVVMSQVAMNLLHYYIVSQRYARNEDDNLPFSPQLPNPVEEKCDGFIEDEFSLQTLDGEPISLQNETSMNVLDTTGASEGMLDDLDRSEQLKELLASSYPQLVKAFKRKYDKVSLEALEAEVQELIISLQAATGMLKIFMLSKADDTQGCSHSNTARTVTGESSLNSQGSHTNSSNTGGESGLGTNESHSSNTEKENPNTVETHNLRYSDTSTVSSTDYTTLHPLQTATFTNIEELKSKLGEEIETREELQRQLHQTKGLYTGLLDERGIVSKDVNDQEERVSQLLQELKDTKGRLLETEHHLKELETVQKKGKPSEKHIKDRVKAVLAAKDKEFLNNRELLQRIRDLETVLEEAVTEKDDTVEELNARVVDLAHQLEVADRQLRSSRQFLDEQAAERDLEVEELVKANENLKNQLKERENLATQYAELQTEVHAMENELRDKQIQLEEAEENIDAKQNDLAVARNKVNDLRENVQTLEVQLASKCTEVQQLQNQLQNLNKKVKELNQENQHIQEQLDTVSQNNLSINLISNSTRETVEEVDYASHMRKVSTYPDRQTSISEELENQDLPTLAVKDFTQDFDLSHNYSMLDSFIHRLEKSTLGLETLQFSLMSASPIPDSELSVRDNLDVCEPSLMEDSRTLSPGTLESKLDDKFGAFEKSVEAAVKYTRDLEMRIRNLKAENEEIINERDDLHERLTSLEPLKDELKSVSVETESLRKEFIATVAALKEDLTKSKKREEDLKTQVTHLKEEIHQLQLQNEASVKDVESVKETLQTSKKDQSKMEKTVKQYLEEKEIVRKQNSELLIKISGLQARLEEARRSTSPSETDIRSKISFLHNENEKCRAELTAKYREVDDLQYSVRELQEKLVAREEQLDRLSKATEPTSLPQSALEQARLQIQSLEQELQKEKTSSNALKEKLDQLENIPKPSPTLSNELIVALLDEKSHLLAEVSRQKNALENRLHSALEALRKRKSITEVANELQGKHDSDFRAESWTEKIESSHCQEIQRKQSEQSTEDIVDLGHEKDSDKFIPNETRLSVLSSDSINLKRKNVSLESTPANQVNDKFDSKKKLEDDYGKLQDIVDSKDEEIRSLTEEIEDSVDTPLRNAIDVAEYEQTLKDLRKENEELTSYCSKLESDLATLEANAKDRSHQTENSKKELGEIKKNFEDLSHRNEKIKYEKAALRKKLNDLSRDLHEEKSKCRSLKETIADKESEMVELSSQLSAVQTQLREVQLKHEKALKALNKDQFRELQDIKDRNIEREKDLCKEYEERMCTQVNSVVSKVTREKEEALSNMKKYYEDLTQQLVNKDKNNIDQQKRKVHKVELRSIGTQCDHVAHFTWQPLAESGGESRESSVLSEDSDASNTIKKIMKKVHKEGLQVLTLSEFMFLQSQQNVPVALGSYEDGCQNQEVEVVAFKVQSLEDELGSEKKQKENLEELLQREESEVIMLHKRLQDEALKLASSQAELETLKVDLKAREKHLQMRATKEIKELKEKLEIYERQLSELDKALTNERKNFDSISATLNKERNLNGTFNQEQQQFIKDLRACLEKERIRVLTLTSEKNDLNLARRVATSNDSTLTNSELQLSSLDRSREEELERENQGLRFSLENLKREGMMIKETHERELEEERENARHLRENLSKLENARSLHVLEIEKKNKYIKDLELKLTKYKKENSDLICALKEKGSRFHANSPLPLKLSSKNEDVLDSNQNYAQSLHATLMRTLKEKDNEVNTLKRKLSEMEAETAFIKRAKEDKAPALGNLRIKNSLELIEILQNENVELRKNVHSLTGDKRALRIKILNLEEQLEQSNRCGGHKSTEKVLENQEIGAYAIQMPDHRDNLVQIGSNLNRGGSTEYSENKQDSSYPRYLRWKYNRSESYRFALIWQKEYLMHILRGYRNTEERAIGRLQAIARNVIDESMEDPQDMSVLSTRSRFKSYALVVIAVMRMKYLVTRWNVKKRGRGCTSINLNPTRILTDARVAPLPDARSANFESDQRNLSPANCHVTGLTPPTKEVSESRKNQYKLPVRSRNLFGENHENGDFDDYIERLDYIHSHLGIPKST